MRVYGAFGNGGSGDGGGGGGVGRFSYKAQNNIHYD